MIIRIAAEEISLAITIEVQTLDLYQRASDRAVSEESKNILMQLPNEERVHLVLFGKRFKNRQNNTLNVTMLDRL